MIPNRFVWLVVVMTLSLPAMAQQKNFIMRTMDWGYRLVQGDSSKPYKKYLIPIPILAYKPETRWIFGLSAYTIFRIRQDGVTRPSTVRLNVSYSQEQQFSLRPIVDVFTKGNRWNIRALYNYTDFSEYYWGIGTHTPESAKELYGFKMNKGFVKVARLWAPGLYAGMEYVFENMQALSYTSATGLQTATIPGNAGYTASGMGLTMYYDTRDQIYFPYSGWFMELAATSFDKTLGGGYNFMQTIADLRYYYQLWKANILCFQMYSQHTSGTVPFRMMGTLGNEMYMRGYYTGRFRDQHAVAVQAELRKTIWGPLGAVVFTGTGTVAPQLSGLTNSLKPFVGVGLRVKAIPRERINIRMDYAIGTGRNAAFYLSLNEAF